MKQSCSICGRPLMGLTVSDSSGSYHPDCFNETPEGKKIKASFEEFQKKVQEVGFDKAIDKSLND